MLFGGRPVRLADLAEDLTLSNDHGVQRRGDPVQMPHGLGVCQPVRILLERRPLDTPIFGEQVEQPPSRALVLDDGVDLCPVARREQHGFGDDALVLEAPEEAPASARRESDTFAHLDRRRVVAHLLFEVLARRPTTEAGCVELLYDTGPLRPESLL